MKISREEAENILNSARVISTSAEPKKGSVTVSLELEDHRTCIIKYNRKSQQKSYFLKTSR